MAVTHYRNTLYFVAETLKLRSSVNDTHHFDQYILDCVNLMNLIYIITILIIYIGLIRFV